MNYMDVTAQTRVFMERLLGSCYWKWGSWWPKMRRKRYTKPALLILVSGMPGILSRFLTSAMKSLEYLAESLFVRPVVKMFIGEVAVTVDEKIRASIVKKVQKATQRLLSGPR
jgi:hypothetical protein